MKSRISRRTAIAGSLAVAAFPRPSLGQSVKFGSKPIRIICAFPAGGLTDQFARAYGDYIAEKTGQQVIVENRTGAGGGVGAVALKQAPNDGHTLMCTVSATLLGNRVLYKNLPYDPDKDFALVALMSSGHLPVVAHKSTGAKTIAEFAAYAKTNKVSGGSYAAGSFAHIAVNEISKQLGFECPIVQHRGESPMWQDMAAGVSHIACGSYQASRIVLDGGHGQAIAVPTSKRMKRLPDVPTFAEQGLTAPVFQLKSWTCFVARGDTPPELVTEASNMIVDGGKTPRLAKILDTFGIDDGAVGQVQFKNIMDTEGPIWLDAARKLNLKQEG
ncbi:MAG: tripartite tricarboxylate transporter substrate binding protein [Hyphomicrobiaceae bacterium]